MGKLLSILMLLSTISCGPESEYSRTVRREREAEEMARTFQRYEENMNNAQKNRDYYGN